MRFKPTPYTLTIKLELISYSLVVAIKSRVSKESGR